MIEVIKKIKIRFPDIWEIMENLNGLVIWLLWSKRLKEAARVSISSFKVNGLKCYQGRQIDCRPLLEFLKKLSYSDIEYFKPFRFSEKTIEHILKCRTYQVFIVRAENEIIGFYFIRYFLNRDCFLGFAVGLKNRGHGLGKEMVSSIVAAAKIARFRLMSTVCVGNVQSLKVHLSAAPFTILKELSSGELLLRLE